MWLLVIRLLIRKQVEVLVLLNMQDPWSKVTGEQDSSPWDKVTASSSSPDPWSKVVGGSSILDKKTSVTQSFGTVNPIEPTSGHKAGDTNFAASMGDPVAVPPGQWQVIQTYNQAPSTGAPGDYTNEGYGNDVVLQNAKTGEKLRFLHMANVNANPGDTIQGGSIVGSTGASGNATGTNLGVEYYNQDGQLQDFEQSPYAQYISY